MTASSVSCLSLLQVGLLLLCLLRSLVHARKPLFFVSELRSGPRGQDPQVPSLGRMQKVNEIGDEDGQIIK